MTPVFDYVINVFVIVLTIDVLNPVAKPEIPL